MSNQKTCEDLRSAISSLELQAGHSRSSSRESPTLSRCGRAVLRASLLAWLEQVAGKTMNVTWLRPFSTSLQSVVLQSSLANKLQQQSKKTFGSTLYSLSWKRKVTPAGRMYYQLQATGLHTKGKGSSSVPWPTAISFDAGSMRPPRLKKDCQRDPELTDSYRYGLEATPYLIGSYPPNWSLSGWSTPRLGGSNESVENWLRRKAQEYEKYPGKGIGSPDVSLQAQLASWTTPSHSDGRRGGTGITANMTGTSLAQQVKISNWPTTGCSDDRYACPTHALTWYRDNGTKKQKRLQDVTALASWPTTSARDGKGGYQGGRIRNGKLSLDALDVVAQLATPDWPMRITAGGMVLTGSYAGMDVSGQLNPEHSRWLMGYPGVWGYSKDMVTPSYLRSQPGSSVNLSSQLVRLAEAIFRNRLAREALNVRYEESLRRDRSEV